MVSELHFCIAYVIVDVLCLVLTIVVAGNMKRDTGSETQVRYFFLLLTANLVFVIFDALWAILMFGPLPSAGQGILSFVNGVCLTAVAFEGYFWFCFSLAWFDNEIVHNRMLRAAASIPVILAPILHIVGAILDQNVIITSDGMLTYGWMHTVIGLIPIAYLVAATVASIHEARVATSSSRRRMALVFITFMVSPFLSGLVDLFVPDTPAVAAGIIISIIFVMVSLLESRVSSDALTGLNNRRRAGEYLEEGIKHAGPETPVYLFILDMNDFKDVNDTYGHLEGDHALQLMATALREAAAQFDAFAARWGGDEFVMICTKNVDHPMEVIDVIREKLSEKVEGAGLEYDLKCAVGYGICTDPKETCGGMIAKADKHLYLDK